MSSNQDLLCTIQENIVDQDRLNLDKNLNSSEGLDKKTKQIIKKRVESCNFNNYDFDDLKGDNDFEIENIIRILSKELNNRNERDIYLVAKFFEKTDLENKFKIDKIDELDLKKFILLCASLTKYHFIKKDEILFNEGDKGDKFYIVLEGELEVIKSREREVQMTSIEYLTFLIDLKIKKLKHCLKKTMKANINIFPIEKKDLNGLNDKLNYLKKKTNVRRSMNKEETEKFVREFYQFEEEKNNLKREKEINKNSVLNKVDKDLINVLKCHVLEHVMIKIFEPLLITRLEKGKYFGDVALEKRSNTRNATILAKKNCHLGEIYIDDYISFIFEKKKNLKQKEISFLVSNFFFQNVKNEYFESHYFHNFTYHDLKKGEILFHQNQVVDDIYIIKEGEISLNSYFSLDGLCNTIEILSEKIRLKVKKLDRVDFDKYEGLMQEYLKQRQHKVLICKSKQILVLEEFYYNLKNLYTAEVISPVIKYYKINKHTLLNMLKYDKSSSKEMQNYIKEKLGALVQRLIDIRNTTFNNIISKAEKDKSKLQHHRNIDKEEQKSRNIHTSFPMMKNSMSFVTVLSRPNNTILSTIKQEEIKPITTERKHPHSRVKSSTSIASVSINSKMSSNNLLSLTSLQYKNSSDITDPRNKQNLINTNNLDKIYRPKSTDYTKIDLIQKEKDLNKSPSHRQKKTINLNNQILQTIQSKDVSNRDIQNTDRSKTPFLNSKKFPNERNNFKNNFDLKNKMFKKQKEQNKEELFCTGFKNIAVLNIDGKKLNNSEKKKEKILIEDKTNCEIKSSLKLFPSFVNIKGCINIKYRKINYANKMRSLANKIVL